MVETSMRTVILKQTALLGACSLLVTACSYPHPGPQLPDNAETISSFSGAPTAVSVPSASADFASVQPKQAPVQPKPAPVQPKPVPMPPKPAPVQAKPAPVPPKPAPVQPKPAPVPPKPAPAQPKPAPAPPKPTPDKPKPAPAPPKPAPVTPKPNGDQPKPTLQSPVASPVSPASTKYSSPVSPRDYEPDHPKARLPITTMPEPDAAPVTAPVAAPVAVPDHADTGEGSHTSSSSFDNLEVLDTSLKWDLGVLRVGSEPTANNLLSVFAGLKNKTSHRLDIEVQTIYKDNAGNPMNSGSWISMTLKPHEESEYHSASISQDATDFLVRVRLAQHPQTE